MLADVVYPLSDVSIHAPVKGATLVSYFTNGNKSVSIHAPVKGATLMSMTSSLLSAMFQFTLP